MVIVKCEHQFSHAQLGAMQQRQAMADGYKQTELSTPCDLKTPRTLEPILPAVCEKNVLRFFRSSVSGKPHF